MTEIYYVSAGNIRRHYDCGSAEVAAKCFLNYLRRFKKERPTELEIHNESGKKFKAQAMWYFGKLEISSFEGAEGEWWKLIKVEKL